MTHYSDYNPPILAMQRTVSDRQIQCVNYLLITETRYLRKETEGRKDPQKVQSVVTQLWLWAVGSMVAGVRGRGCAPHSGQGGRERAWTITF